MRDFLEFENIAQFTPLGENIRDSAVVLFEEDAQREDSEELRLSIGMWTLRVRIWRQSILCYSKRCGCER